MREMPIRNVAIFIFDEIEVLDFCGPFEVFVVAGRAGSFDVYTVAEHASPIRTRGGMQVIPTYTWDEAPDPHILVVPGGKGTQPLMHHHLTLEWVRATATRAEFVLSVCTGALLLAKAGLLDGLTATTHHRSLELLSESAPGADVVSDRRYVDNGKIITAAGISAGIDASLHLVERLLGREHAEETAVHMEYDWQG